jgi:phosphohistidine phosphatase
MLRHGPAESRAEWTGPEPERPLTERGIKVTRRVAERIDTLDLKLDAIVTSPYSRALETARIVTDVLDADEILHTDEGLEPERFSRGELPRIFSDHPDAEALMLVGHEPTMSRVTADIVGGGRIRLRKSGLIRIDLADPAMLQGELAWLLAPKTMTDS